MTCGEWERAAHYFRLALDANPNDRHAQSLLAAMERELAAGSGERAPGDGGEPS